MANGLLALLFAACALLLAPAGTDAMAVSHAPVSAPSVAVPGTPPVHTGSCTMFARSVGTWSVEFACAGHCFGIGSCGFVPTGGGTSCGCNGVVVGCTAKLTTDPVTGLITHSCIGGCAVGVCSDPAFTGVWPREWTVMCQC